MSWCTCLNRGGGGSSGGGDGGGGEIRKKILNNKKSEGRYNGLRKWGNIVVKIEFNDDCALRYAGGGKDYAVRGDEGVVMMGMAGQDEGL